MYDSLLICPRILLLRQDQLVIEKDQVVGVKDGRIAYVGPQNAQISASKTYQLNNHLVCPGFVNTHTHLAMSLLRGLADNLPLMNWLEDYIFPLENGLVSEDFVRAGTNLSLMELTLSGVTTFCDMYFYSQAIASATDQSGLRGQVGVTIPSSKEPHHWKKRASDLISLYKDHPRISVTLSPHAPYTVKPQDLKEAGEYARQEDILLSIHVSESQWEVEEIQKKYGRRPVQHLHHLGVTGENSLFVHCVHLDDQDIQTISKTKTSMSYNPESNMKLSNGIAPVYDLLKKGIHVGLGTDGSASNNNLNFFREMSAGAKLQALKYGGEAFTAMDMLKIATIGGAQALGMEKEIGSIDVGKRADLIALDLNHISFQPGYHLISDMIYSSWGNEVDFVMCEGQVLMENQQLKVINKEQVLQEARFFAHQVQDFLKSSNKK